MQCYMYTSIQITTTEQNTVYWNLIWHVPKCKCLNRFKSIQIPYFTSLIIAVYRQSKQESNITNQLAITMNTTQHNKIHKCHKFAAFAWLKSHLRGFTLESGSQLSRAGCCYANGCSAILSSCKLWAAHQNREREFKPFPSPATAPKICSEGNSTRKRVFCKINKKQAC